MLGTVPALGEDSWANFQGTPDFPIIHIKSRFYYINGPHNQYVRIDMSLTFIFRQGLPGTGPYTNVENSPNVGWS